MKIGITNLKGGVGKTTLSINLAVCLAHMGYRVVIVDTDANQSSLSWYCARDESLPEVTVVCTPDPRVLKRTVDQMKANYDIVIIDGTPNLSEMNTRIIMAADILIIPTRPGAHDYRSMKEFMTRLDQVRELQEVYAYFLINEYDARLVLHRNLRESLETYSVPLLSSMLKSRTAYNECSYNGTGAYEYTDRKAKNEVIGLTSEILKLAEHHHFIN